MCNSLLYNLLSLPTTIQGQNLENGNKRTLLNWDIVWSRYATKKTAVPKKGSKREDMTLQLLSKFKQKLHTVKADEHEAAQEETKVGEALKKTCLPARLDVTYMNRAYGMCDRLCADAFSKGFWKYKREYDTT